MEDIEIVKGGNFGDSYYWDYRVWFYYKGLPYTYLGIGSYSGYVPCSNHIGRGFLTMLSGQHVDMDDEFYVVSDLYEGNKQLIIDLVEKLIKSGEDTLDEYGENELDLYDFDE